ncbi:MAG: hypothetical protein U1E18_23375 [Brevundimonas sp.]|uniref:hypothetical protein n=1 Tax=Brevundimonas sp. TaxID=1871086 RepID=UPI002AB9D486|nr:hypothetical protein [Brevundimonas sp.]MDZ4112518.1 hypothetical protein [Brevundimonas sp.]
MRRLTHSFSYLFIRHPAKWRYDFLYPGIIALLLVTMIVVAGSSLNISGERGVLDQINGLLGILVGFFIAALAAVATFDRPSMDDPMPGIAPIMKIKEKGVFYDIPLSRRIFLSQLFGYLTVASLIVFAMGAIGQLSASAAESSLVPVAYETARLIFVFAYSFGLANVIVNTLLGVFYLSFRIHDVGSKRKPLS